MTKEQMMQRIDLVADTIRNTIVGDPLRAFEYKQAELDAIAFKNSGYLGTIPQTIQSWVDASGMTKEEATDNIIYEAVRFNTLMLALRDQRLKGKAAVKNATSDSAAEAEFYNHISIIKALV